MNERIKELWSQAGGHYNGGNQHTWPEYTIDDPEKFAELIVAEAFRSGMLYSAKKYKAVSDEQFTGNDVAMFLEMEACELSDEDIKQHFGVELRMNELKNWRNRLDTKRICLVLDIGICQSVKSSLS